MTDLAALKGTDTLRHELAQIEEYILARQEHRAAKRVGLTAAISRRKIIKRILLSGTALKGTDT